MGVTGTALNTSIAQAIIAVEPFGTLLSLATKLVPYLLIIAAFTFTYLFMPNTKVRFVPALLGGVAAGVLWQTVGWVFATVMSASISTSYTAIYSSFAFLFVFMIWLWWSWLILLVGSSVAFYKQHPEYLHINAHDLALTNRQKEELSIQIMAIMGQRFYANTAPVSITEFVNSLHLPQQSIEQQLGLLVEHGLLVNVDQDELTYMPARPLEELSLKSVIDTVREPGPNSHIKNSLCAGFGAVNTVLMNVDNSLDQVLGCKTVKDIITELESELEVDNDKLKDKVVRPIK
jgi:membrane protein